ESKQLFIPAWRLMMTRMIFAAIAPLAGVFFGLQPAQAYQAPWCAVVNKGTGNMYWDCQYSSFDDCYRRGNILAGNRGGAIPARTTSLDTRSKGRPGNVTLVRNSSAS
ncbi:MAG: hypothetical protein WB052_25515, partial [Pseudolabrys sp.]